MMRVNIQKVHVAYLMASENIVASFPFELSIWDISSFFFLSKALRSQQLAKICLSSKQVILQTSWGSTLTTGEKVSCLGAIHCDLLDRDG